MYIFEFSHALIASGQKKKNNNNQLQLSIFYWPTLCISLWISCIYRYVNCIIFITGTSGPEVVLYYPRCLGNKVLCWTSHIGVISLCYTYASMLHFGDEDGILYMYEDAWEIQWSFDFPCVTKKVVFFFRPRQLDQSLSTCYQMAGIGLFGRVGEFSPERETFRSYVERMEMFFMANNIMEKTGEGKEEANLAVTNRKRAIFLTEIGPDAYSTLSNLLAPEKPKTLLLLILSKH